MFFWYNTQYKFSFMIRNIKNQFLISLKHNKKCIKIKQKNLNFKNKFYFKWFENNIIFLNLKKKKILKMLINDNKKKKK